MATVQEEWLSRLLYSSVPLRKVDEKRMPIGLASGCLVDLYGRRILLTVWHATKDQGRWAIELKFDPALGTAIYQVGSFNFLGKMRLGSSAVDNVDFSYSEVPSDIVSYFQEISPTGAVLSEKAREVFTPDFSIEPSREEVYGFSGQVKPEMHGKNALVTQMAVYPGLKYVSTEGDYHVFELPVSHPGHEHFQGCSGAPILDSRGNVVALVCHGDKERNAIFGVSLAKYRVALYATYGVHAGV